MQPERIVQITDLHILEDDSDEICGVNPDRSLELVIDDINNLSTAARLVIASGDLTDSGRPVAYRRLQKILQKLNCPVYVMAGNHDETEAMLSNLCGERIYYRDAVECRHWKLLLIDSKTPDASHGSISADELQRIEIEMSEHDRPLLLAMHHTPLRLCASPSCQMQNAESLFACLERQEQVRAVIAGHTHNEVDKMVNTTRILTTPSTMVQVTHNQHEAFTSNDEFWDYHVADNSRHGYRIVDLFADGSLHSQVRWVSSGLT